MLVSNDKVKIAGTGSHAPERIVTNAELATRVATTDQWVRDMLGVRERRVAADGELTSDLAFRAGLNAIQDAGIDKEEVGLVIVATATPDRKAPSTACIAKSKMGIVNHAPAYDLSAVCSGFLYAMTVAGQAIESGAADNALVIGADTFSKITDWTRRDCVFFGDGAGAVLLQRSYASDGLFLSHLYSDVSGLDEFTVYPGDPFYTMHGKAVYETGTKVLTRSILHVLEKSGLKPEDVSVIIPHQPSIRILHETASRLGIPVSRVRTNMDRYANTSGATIPLLLDEVARERTLKRGDVVVFAAVGAGWTFGASIYRWQ